MCEHYGLYGGCHVTSPLDYYNRKEMTLTRHEADPQHNYIYTTRRRSRTQRSLEHNWSRRQIFVSNKFTQIIGNTYAMEGRGDTQKWEWRYHDIKWCRNTNNGARALTLAWPWSLSQAEQTPPRLQRKLNKQSAFDTMSFKHVGNNDVHSLH